jgi:uncharacterized protein involved in exopolysaccharide biosynthesis
VSESLRAAIERMIAVQNSPIPLTAGGSTVNAELMQLRATLGTLRSRYTDEHPDVRAIKARISTLEREEAVSDRSGEAPVPTAAAANRLLVDQARKEVEKLKGRLSDIEAQIAAFSTRVEEAPRTEQEIATLSRDHQKLNENYTTLLNRKLEAQMAAKLERRWKGEQFRILDPANLPERPFYPNVFLFVVVGAIVGLALGLGSAVAADFLDHSIKGVREIEALLPYPVLAVVPSLRGTKARVRPRSELGGRGDAGQLESEGEAADVAAPRSL